MSNPPSEFQTLTRMLERLREAEECARGIALMRSDTEWVKVAHLIGKLHAQVAAYSRMRANSTLGLVVPELGKAGLRN